MASSKESDWKSLALKSAGIIAGAGFTGVSAWLIYSRFFLDHHRTLPPAIDAARRETALGEFGRVSHYEDTTGFGAPLILAHGVSPTASAYEMRPLFEHYRGKRPVYALDLPGFGFSDRVRRAYSPEFYAGALAAWIEIAVSRGEAADVVASGLTCEFVARAALGHPRLFRTLTLASPTGFDQEPAGSSDKTGDRVHRTLSAPLWSQAFYDALVTTPSIRHTLRKAFDGQLDEGLVRYSYATSHQPGARFAPFCFISGKLFTRDILSSAYARLSLPVLVAYDHDEYLGFGRLPGFLETHENWQAVRIPDTKSMAHFEEPQKFAAALRLLP